MPLVVEEQPQLDRPAFLASRSAAQHAPVSIDAGPPASLPGLSYLNQL